MKRLPDQPKNDHDDVVGFYVIGHCAAHVPIILGQGSASFGLLNRRFPAHLACPESPRKSRSHKEANIPQNCLGVNELFPIRTRKSSTLSYRARIEVCAD